MKTNSKDLITVKKLLFSHLFRLEKVNTTAILFVLDWSKIDPHSASFIFDL